MNCPRCQAEMPSDAKFCPECGAKLTAVCAQCGAANAPQHKFSIAGSIFRVRIKVPGLPVPECRVRIPSAGSQT